MRVKHRLFVLHCLLLPTACAAPGAESMLGQPATRPSATFASPLPVDRPSAMPSMSSPLPSASEATGTWLLDGAADGGPPRSDACDHYVVAIERLGEAFRLRRFAGERVAEEEAAGRIEADRLRLQGFTHDGLVRVPVTYDLLRRDADTWVGTRDGRAVTLTRDATTACQTTMPTVAVRGWVYDSNGSPVSGATVTFRSTNQSNPFELVVRADNGSYAAYRIPAGVTMAVEAVKGELKSRTRERAFSWSGHAEWPSHQLHFGGDNTTADDGAHGYPLMSISEASP